MINFVNQDDFIKWYNSVSAEKASDEKALLNDVYLRYCETKKSVYVLSADKTVTGKEESYRYNFDDVGCCGASTIYIYF